MTPATVDRDIILRIGRGPVNIPDNYPRNVGLERLRWDGERIIDLATMGGMWVECIDGRFVLHAVEVPGSVYVEMTYADRKKLYFDGMIKVKTEQQIAEGLRDKQAEAVRNFLASRLVTPRELAELIMILAGMVAVTAIYARTGNAQAGAYLTNIMPQLSALPLQQIAGVAPSAYSTLKDIFDAYFNKLESI